MNENAMRFRVGVVVVAAASITVILVVLFGEGRDFGLRQYRVQLLFPRAPGVTVDTPVRKSGVLIGRVSNVELLPEGPVRITARIDSHRRLRKSEVCVIKTASLLGDAVLEFVPGEGPTSDEFIQDGDLLADGKVASNPLEVLTSLEGDLDTAIGSIRSAAGEIETLARNLNNSIGSNGDQIQRILTKTESALDTFETTASTINDFVDDPEVRDGLKRALAEVPELFTEVKQTMENARATMQGFDRVSQKAERNLDNLEGFTRPFGEQGEQLVTEIASSVRNLEALSAELVVFGRSLNSREGTLGQLIHDPVLSEQIRESVENIHKGTRRIQPILQNVQTFTDKIARDPRSLGLRGALERRPTGVGLK